MRQKLSFLLIVLLCVACNKDQDQQPVAPAKKVETTKRIENPVLLVAPEKMREAMSEAYRLKPDRRFLISLGQVHSFLSGRKAEDPEVSFHDGHWRIRYAGVDVGMVPEFPDFKDFLELEVRWAQGLAKQYPQQWSSATNNGSDPLVEKDLQEFMLPAPFRALYKIEGLWAKQKSPYLLFSAGRAYACILAQQLDTAGVADVVTAKGFALLVLSKALTSLNTTEIECQISTAMGYSGFGEATSRSLDSNNALRMFLSHDENLKTLATKKDSSNQARFLYLLQTDEQNSPALWYETANRLFPNADGSLGVASTGFPLVNIGQVEASSMDALPAKIAAIAGAAGKAELGEIARSKSSVFVDSNLVSRSYKSAVLSGRFYEFLYVEYGRSTSTSSPEDELDQEYNQWLSDYGATRKGRPGLGLIQRSTTELKELGAPPILETLNSFLKNVSFDSPDVPAATRLTFQRVDSRPNYLTALMDIELYWLRDRNLMQKLCEALMKSLGESSTFAKAKAAIFLGEYPALRNLLQSRYCNAACAGSILSYWQWADPGHAGEIEQAFDKMLGKFPHDWAIPNNYIDFLRKKRDYRKACTITQDWLNHNNDPDHVGFTHSHVRLAYNYWLAGEYQKGLDILKPIEGFPAGERQKAPLLNSLGRKKEAEELARQYAAENPTDIEGQSTLCLVLWQNGKYDEAAEVLQKNPLSTQEFQEQFATLFFLAFEHAPIVEMKKAVASMRIHHVPLQELGGLPGLFSDAGNPEVAFELASSIQPGASAHEDNLIEAYGYLKAARGKDEAVRWLETLIPPNRRNPLSIKFLYTKNYDLLWDLIQVPDPKDHPDWVWLFRATASALIGPKDPHRQELLKYYAQSNKNPYHQMGQYLMGIIPEKDLFALAADAGKRCGIYYYMGVKAQGEGRLVDASDDFRVAIETGQREETGWHMSFRTLLNWPYQGLWAVEKGGIQ